jgi:hypothetical protein
MEDEAEGAEATVAETSRKALTEVLGADRRDRILSALYLARQDAVHNVRQSSIQIWKALVHNTPKTGMDSFRPAKRLSFVNDSYSQGNFARTRDPTHVASIFGGNRTARGSILHLFLVVLTNNTFRPVSAPRVSCARSLGSVFWAR